MSMSDLLLVNNTLYRNSAGQALHRISSYRHDTPFATVCGSGLGRPSITARLRPHCQFKHLWNHLYGEHRQSDCWGSVRVCWHHSHHEKPVRQQHRSAGETFCIYVDTQNVSVGCPGSLRAPSSVIATRILPPAFLWATAPIRWPVCPRC